MAEWTIAPVCKIGGLTAFTGSNPVPTTSAATARRRYFSKTAALIPAHIAQPAERVLGKNEVIGSNPIVGSVKERPLSGLSSCQGQRVLGGEAAPVGAAWRLASGCDAGDHRDAPRLVENRPGEQHARVEQCKDD